MHPVELQPMRFFLISKEIPEYLQGPDRYGLVPFPSDIFPEHFNHEFREDAVYQKLDELAKHLYGAEGRYCEHHDDEALDVVVGGWECFIPIDDNGKYRKIPDLTKDVNCSEAGVDYYVIGNADFSKYLWVVCEHLPTNWFFLPPKGESFGLPNLDNM